MDLSKIDASLSYGKLFTNKVIGFLYFAVAAELLFPLVTIIVFIAILAGAANWHNDVGISLIIGDIIFILIAVFLIVFIKHSKKQRENIILWTKDAIELSAFSKRLDLITPEFMPYQTQVDFEIDGEKYHRVSAPGGMIWGYHKVFAKYNNKIIDILYSKAYDQVLILKPTAKLKTNK